MGIYHEAIAEAMSHGPRTATYGWIIWKDLLAESYGGQSAVGTAGPNNIDDSVLAHLKDGKGQAFRLYDDDGEHYYSGKAVALDDDGKVLDHFTDGEDEAAFGPLWDFGEPDSGCTELRYVDKRTGRWATL